MPLSLRLLRRCGSKTRPIALHTTRIAILGLFSCIVECRLNNDVVNYYAALPGGHVKCCISSVYLSVSLSVYQMVPFPMPQMTLKPVFKVMVLFKAEYVPKRCILYCPIADSLIHLLNIQCKYAADAWFLGDSGVSCVVSNSVGYLGRAFRGYCAPCTLPIHVVGLG